MSGHTKWRDLKHKATPEALDRARRDLEAVERLHRSRGAAKQPPRDARKA